jgi:hypothetical protein
MKRNLLILYIFLLLTSHSVGQSFDFAKQVGGTDYDWGTGVTTDNQGNIFMTGYFSGVCWFDTAYTLTNGCFDTYIAKLNPNGSLVWAKGFGGINCDYSNNICIDENQNVYIAGMYSISIDFGDTIILGKNEFDAFIAKFDNNGNLKWAKTFAGNGDDYCYAIKYRDGYVYATGAFSDTVSFDAINLISSGFTDSYLAKIDTSGNIIWIKKAGGTGDDNANGIGIDASDNVFLSGRFSNISNFGTFQLNSNGQQDIFLCKYNSNGTEQWVKQMGGTWDDQSGEVALDHFGNLYAIGRVRGNFSIDTNTFDGLRGFMLTKFDNNGNLKWLKQGDATWDCGWSDLVIDNLDNIYVAGDFSDTAFFENDTIIGTGNYTYQGCFARFANDGSMLWVKHTTNTGTCIPACIYSNNDSILYLTGMYSGLVTFDDITLTPIGSNDIFIVKLSKGYHYGVNEVDKIDNKLIVYPNPAHQSATLQFSNPKNENFTLTLYNTYGQLVREINNITGDKVTIERQDLTNGMYFFRLATEGKVIGTGKMVME